MFDRSAVECSLSYLILGLALPVAGVLAGGNSASARAAGPSATPLTWTQVHQAPAGQYFYSIFFPTPWQLPWPRVASC